MTVARTRMLTTTRKSMKMSIGPMRIQATTLGGCERTCVAEDAAGALWCWCWSCRCSDGRRHSDGPTASIRQYERTVIQASAIIAEVEKELLTRNDKRMWQSDTRCNRRGTRQRA